MITPGPWFVEEQVSQTWIQGGSNGTVGVAKVYETANARAIAALPDLIAAAEGAIAALSQPALFPADADCAKQYLRDALRKAGVL